MRWHYVALLFYFGVNVSIFMLSSAGVPYVVGFNMTITPSEAQEIYNATEIMEDWSGQYSDLNIFGYITNTIQYMINLFGTLLIGFPNMVHSLGAPTWFATAVDVMWGIPWVMWFLEVLSNRNLTGD